MRKRNDPWELRRRQRSTPNRQIPLKINAHVWNWEIIAGTQNQHAIVLGTMMIPEES
jgi:hypothetical protein